MEENPEENAEQNLEENLEDSIDGTVQENLQYGRMTLGSSIKNFGKHLMLLNPGLQLRYQKDEGSVLKAGAVCGQPSGNASVTNADSMCARPQARPRGAVTKDFDCGKPKNKNGTIYTDQSGAKPDTYIWPPNSVWKSMDCGKKDPRGNIYADKSCALSKRMIWGGGAHRDSDCGKKSQAGGSYADQDCSLDNGSGRWNDQDCGHTNSAGKKYKDSSCNWLYGGCFFK